MCHLVQRVNGRNSLVNIRFSKIVLPLMSYSALISLLDIPQDSPCDFYQVIKACNILGKFCFLYLSCKQIPPHTILFLSPIVVSHETGRSTALSKYKEIRSMASSDMRDDVMLYLQR